MNRPYLFFRKTLGILGIILPFAVYLVGFLCGVDNPSVWYLSISATYWSNAMQLFVGIVFTTGVFLLTYPCYDWRDHLINKAAAIGALLLIFFPVCTDINIVMAGLIPVAANISSIIHYIGAATLFTCLTINILWLFPKSDGNPTKEKLIRNKVYYICGSIMASCLGMFVVNMFLHLESGGVPVIWIVEAVMLLAFGIAWITKGEAIKALNDS